MDSSVPGLAPGQRLVKPLAAALAAKGPVYRPRTEHLNDDGSPIYTNRLILETSPYLLQHAHNPVSWHAWGDAPFDRARTENKLVLLSVGYSTCHWCHVMERESFEDTEVAAFMNERFVSIKVDREERPDVDSAYMAAVQLMTGRGGWPMTVVLTPDRQPVFGGTYFPARDGDRGAPIGFLSILRQLDAQWRADPGSLIGQAQYVSSRIRRASEGDVPGDAPDAGAIRAGVGYLESTFDPTWGGFGRAPKFPRPATLELLARYYRRTRDRGALRMLVRTLERMAAGGVVDHIGGGFHRYSTDREWLVPHFEKMLYDQAQLAVVYLEAYQIAGRLDFARVARETLDYVSREMTDERGGFYSATDADSAGPDGESGEGLFFTWTPAELDAVLGAERSRLVQVAFAVTANGNFEGRSVLHAPRPVETVAQQLGIEVPALRHELDLARAVLYEARSMRTPPLRDDKVITAWNGLMISAFARGGRALGNDEDVETAARAARFVLTELRQHGRLKRAWRGVAGDTDAFLDDYAFLIAGLLDLYEATGTLAWLQEALDLQRELDTQFWDARDGGYTFTGRLHEDLLARDKPSYDGAEPAGGSVAALNLLRLCVLTDDQAYREKTERLFAAHAGELASGVALPKMLTALDFYLDRPVQVVIVTPQDGEKGVRPLLDTLHAAFLPNRAVVVGAEGQLAAQSELVPLAGGKRALGGRATAYVCRGTVCEPPTSDPAVLAELLAAADPLRGGGRIGY